MVQDGGKGSSPRKQRDDESYRSNWDKIFGKKKPMNYKVTYLDEYMEAMDIKCLLHVEEVTLFNVGRASLDALSEMKKYGQLPKRVAAVEITIGDQVTRHSLNSDTL